MFSQLCPHYQSSIQKTVVCCLCLFLSNVALFKIKMQRSEYTSINGHIWNVSWCLRWHLNHYQALCNVFWTAAWLWFPLFLCQLSSTATVCWNNDAMTPTSYCTFLLRKAYDTSIYKCIWHLVIASDDIYLLNLNIISDT